MHRELTLLEKYGVFEEVNGVPSCGKVIDTNVKRGKNPPQIPNYTTLD